MIRPGNFYSPKTKFISIFVIPGIKKIEYVIYDFSFTTWESWYRCYSLGRWCLILFTREEILLETSSLGVLAALLLRFELFPYATVGEQLHAIDFFGGFKHKALIAVCALMVVGQGMVRTGALEPLGRF